MHTVQIRTYTQIKSCRGSLDLHHECASAWPQFNNRTNANRIQMYTAMQTSSTSRRVCVDVTLPHLQKPVQYRAPLQFDAFQQNSNSYNLSPVVSIATHLAQPLGPSGGAPPTHCLVRHQQRQPLTQQRQKKPSTSSLLSNTGMKCFPNSTLFNKTPIHTT